MRGLTRSSKPIPTNVWYGYMAGTWAAMRDKYLDEARAANDLAIRRLLVIYARRAHREYLSFLRRAVSVSAN